MKKLVALWLFLLSGVLLGQTMNDENILRLKSKYDVEIDLKCQIKVRINVDGMVIPDKEVYVEFSKGGKTRVEGKGLSLLPKRGTVEQFKTLLTTPMQAIFLSKRGENMVYKLVSLDPSADWITADIVLDPEALLIYESVVNTRKHGTFTTVNQYDSGDYPTRTEVSFEVKKFDLPLKFIGSEQSRKSSKETDEEVHGTVILEYNYL
jgi:hypothetical protein